MRDVRSSAILVTIFTLAAGGLGCEEQTPLGSSGSPESYSVRPMGQQPVGQIVENMIGGPEGSGPQPDWLVRVSRDHSIRSIAVSDQYLYFVAWWEGVYRLPKTGGTIEVVEAAQQTQFEPATATGNAVYWVRTTYDDKDNDYPYIQIRRRLDDGSPSQLLFEGDWAVAQHSNLSTFQADDSGVYMVAHRAGGPTADLHRVAAGSAQIQPVMTINTLRWPSWVLQPEGLYLVSCSNNNQANCTLGIVAKDGDGALSPLASLDTPAELYAADAENLYLLGSGIWKVSKQGGTPVELVPAAVPGRGSRFLLVDDTHVYFSTGTGNTIQLRSLPKAGGATASLGDGIAIANVMQIVQDRDRLYLLRSNGTGEGSEISVVAKR